MFGSQRWVRSLVGGVCASALVIALAAAAQARPAVVRALASHWSPTSVTVAPGAVVRWRGVSGFHDVTAYAGDWSLHRSLAAGATVSRRFGHAGTFLFRCTFHSTLIGTQCTGMCGSVRVRA